MTHLPLSFDAAYAVFARKDLAYDGRLFLGVSSTGIFCRPGCPARLPKRDNCKFYADASDALAAGYRACKRCHPAVLPGEAGPLIKELIARVEAEPTRRWTEADLADAGIDPSTARRHFKARFGMSFIAYARARRLGLAARSGDASVIEKQLNTGYESASGFRAAFGKAFGAAPKDGAQPLFIDWHDSPHGPIITIADEAALYMLEFTVRKNLGPQMEKLSRLTGRAIVPGRTPITEQITGELSEYFDGKLTEFKTPVALLGTDFQTRTWQALIDIPYGHTKSYLELARAVGNPKAFRAVANSNANNRLAIIVPCHRVIGSDGGLGGYAGGLDKKRALLDMENPQSARLF